MTRVNKQVKIDSRNRCDKRTFFCFRFDTRFYHRIFLRVDVIIERFEHFRQSVIESIKRRSLNIFDDDDDDIHDDDDKNAKCVRARLKYSGNFNELDDILMYKVQNLQKLS